MIYLFIKNNEVLFPIDKMCKVLEVGRRSYYWWKRFSTSNKALKKEKFKELITSVYFEFKQRYGSPRIIDLYDRNFIAWSLGNNMSTQNTTLPAWGMSLKNRNIGKGLIFHSDQGVQYANNILQFIHHIEKCSFK